MGKLKEEALSVLQEFVAANREASDEDFPGRLQTLQKKLTGLLSRSSGLIIHTDGSSKGNPGAARIGIQFSDPGHRVLLRESRDIGIRTNNEAEYTAVLEALELALKGGHRRVELRSDSELVVNQLNHVYRVKDAKLRPYYEKIQELIKRFDRVEIRHVRREENRNADILSN